MEFKIFLCMARCKNQGSLNSFLSYCFCLSLPHSLQPHGCSMPGFPFLHYLLDLFKLMSIESMIPSNHHILCHPLLLLPSVFPSIRVFSNESALHIRWPKYWSVSFSISPFHECSGLISFRIGLTGLISLQSKELSTVFSNTTVQKHQFFCTQLSL